MDLSLQIARPLGIPVRIHWTFWLIVAWFIYLGLRQGHDAPRIAQDLAFVFAIFLCVLLHEFGHALAALRYGIRTRSVTLLPIGGVAALERFPEKPSQQLVVAVAGPAVNVAIAAVLVGVLFATGLPEGLTDPDPDAAADALNDAFLLKLLIANLFLVAFNALPAFPMDGGRVLRAILAMRMPPDQATAIAGTVGKLMAMLFAAAGLFLSNPFLFVIALFVWLGADAEVRFSAETTLLGGSTVADAMETRYITLAPTDTLARAAAELLAGAQRDFPVLDDDRLAGMLDREALLRALAEHGKDHPVARAMTAPCLELDPATPAPQAVERMRTQGCRAAVATHDGRPVGLVTSENIADLIAVRSALRARDPLNRGFANDCL